MNRGKTKPWCRRLVSILLVLAIAVSCMPLSAFAQGEEDSSNDGLLCTLSAKPSPETGYEIFNDYSQVDPNLRRAPLPAASSEGEAFDTYNTFFYFSPIKLTTYFYRNLVSYCFLEVSQDNFNTYTRYVDKYGNPFSYAFSTSTISGLASNTYYQVRLRATNYYGTVKNGSIFYSTTIHTGMPDLKVKSVKAKAVKVKKHKQRVYYYWVKLGTRVFYTYRVKVTIKLQEAPGTPGIYIQYPYGLLYPSVWVPGNKKSYTVTLPITYTWESKKSPKRRAKIDIKVFSAVDPDNHGGYSYPRQEFLMKVK